MMVTFGPQHRQVLNIDRENHEKGFVCHRYATY